MPSRAGQLDALYAELPKLDCLGLCSDSCHYIGMTKLESQRIKRSKGFEISMMHSPCPALNFMGRCGVYDLRPMICRLWGLTEDMPCHYGCKPERYLTREEGFSFLARAREIAGEDRV